VKFFRIVAMFVLNIYSPVFGRLFNIAMVFGETLTTLDILPWVLAVVKKKGDQTIFAPLVKF